MKQTMTTAISTPHAQHNAIELAAFVVVLNQPPSPTALENARLAMATQHANALPGEQAGPPANSIFIGFGPAAAPPGEFLRFNSRPDGTHAWRAQVSANVITVSCFDYTRFDDVWATAQGYLTTILAALDAGTMVQEIGHQVVDRFLYPEGMTLAEYEMAELFRRDSEHLTPRSWRSGLLWHVFQGWFVNEGPTSRVLNQLNISNTQLLPSTRIANLIDHRITAQYAVNTPVDVARLLPGTREDALSLDGIMRLLHQQNKLAIQALLTDEKLAAIHMDKAQ